MFEGLGNTLTTLGNTITTQLPQAINTTIGLKNAGASAANAVSRAAQENQFAFNSAEAAAQRQYNEEMWNKNAAYNSAEAAANRAFQAEEAEKTRKWQEKLANTSYQRAVEDLKKAGLNPILAYMNGATTPSGATASGSAASSSPTSGAAASGSNYTGQATNISDMLALIGAIGTSLGSALQVYGQAAGNQAMHWQETAQSWMNDLMGRNNKSETMHAPGGYNVHHTPGNHVYNAHGQGVYF